MSMALVLTLILSFAAALLSAQPITPHSPDATKGFSLALIHRDSIHSLLYPGNLTTIELLQRWVNFSEARSLWLKSPTTQSQPQDVLGIRPKVSGDKYRQYVVSVDIGTPRTALLLLLDTASDITWTQNHPCKPCFPQREPHYETAHSNTYRPLPCSHPLCNPRVCVDGVCQFKLKYFGGKATKGALATDHFTFESRTGGDETIPDVVFGCSTESSKDMFDTNIKIAGILGMGRGPQSLVSQLGDGVLHRFSYCLLHWDQPGFSYLRFGNDITERPGAQSTPFVPTSMHTFYYLYLLDISINHQRLRLPNGTFQLNRDGSGGCLIDVGTSMTRLTKTAYDHVRSILVSYFESLHLQPSNVIGINLCYHMPTRFQDFPSMTLHFMGADLLLGMENLFIIDPRKSEFCFSMYPDNDTTILGASLQANIQFIYDLGTQRLTFATTLCN